ncbi:hypothetical protein P3L10_032244 [Capsicum annuum]
MAKNLPQSLSVSGGGGEGASSSCLGSGAPFNMDRQMQVAEQLVLNLRYPVHRQHALPELSKKRKLFHDLALLLCNSFGTSVVLLQMDRRMQLAEWLVFDFRNPDFRENALVELSKRRELFHDLAPVLWNSFGTTTILLQEIISIYPFLSPPNLTPAQSNRVCNVLALLQCVASHSDTKMLLLNAKIPLYLYPFLDTTSESRPFEYLRLTSLGVIGALVKADDTEVVRVLLPTAIIPRCLRVM